MSSTHRTVVVAGVGHLGRYLVEELQSSPRFEVAVLSRSGSEWLEQHRVPTFQSDYSESSVLDILDNIQAYALISFIQPPDDLYLPIHTALLNACCKSRSCKRFIPSEWVGSIEDFPELPAFYGASREPFRQVLRQSHGVEWTLFCCGWLADYFLPKDKTYMPAIPDEFPIDPNGFKALIRGSGEEPQSWTCAREVTLAVARLLDASRWDSVTYVAGEWSTFNSAIKIMESFYDRTMEVSHKTVEEIDTSLSQCKGVDGPEKLVIAQIEQWMVSGASCVPRKKAEEQRVRFFRGMAFSDLASLLKKAQGAHFI